MLRNVHAVCDIHFSVENVRQTILRESTFVWFFIQTKVVLNSSKIPRYRHYLPAALRYPSKCRFLEGSRFIMYNIVSMMDSMLIFTRHRSMRIYLYSYEIWSTTEPSYLYFRATGRDVTITRRGGFISL